MLIHVPRVSCLSAAPSTSRAALDGVKLFCRLCCWGQHVLSTFQQFSGDFRIEKTQMHVLTLARHGSGYKIIC